MDDLRNKTFSNNNFLFKKNFSNENINSLSNTNINEKINDADRRYEDYITTLKNQSFTYTKSFIGSVEAIQSVAVVPYLSAFLIQVRN